jgi:1-aminocyclopropane-1-carboxylate deaminase/D-cysteine desulfhydrase-like pyridoxal-dependent ACC family enzyme
VSGKSDVITYDQYIGEAYGVPTSDGMEAINSLRAEGVLPVSVYPVNVLLGSIDRIYLCAISRENNVIFLHTGGLLSSFTKVEDLVSSSLGIS